MAINAKNNVRFTRSTSTSLNFFFFFKHSVIKNSLINIFQANRKSWILFKILFVLPIAGLFNLSKPNSPETKGKSLMIRNLRIISFFFHNYSKNGKVKNRNFTVYNEEIYSRSRRVPFKSTNRARSKWGIPVSHRSRNKSLAQIYLASPHVPDSKSPISLLRLQVSVFFFIFFLPRRPRREFRKQTDTFEL